MCLLQRHRGWILRIASLIKIEKQHSPSFLLIHIVESTFHHLRWSPFLSRTGNVSHAFLRANIQELTFHQTNYCGSLQTIRWFRRSDLVVIPPLSPEREICDILLLSFIQTKWNQLSTDFVGPPFFQERSIVSHAFL